MPLSKTQIQYLAQKLRSETNAAQNAIRKAYPHSYTSQEIKQALTNAGFIVTDWSYFKDISPPLTKEMQANKDKVDAFVTASNNALNDAIDMANLGGADEALALLRDFTAKLAELAR